MKEKIQFIHIGKCGGTYVRNSIGPIPSVHLRKPCFRPDHKYIIWIRNPIARFVSAFNMSSALVHCETDNLDPTQLSLHNSLAPEKIRRKIRHNIAFSPEYDSLIRCFESANQLAESITSTDEEIRRKAKALMHHRTEHIYKGIGWYLSDGNFVSRHHRNVLFVGTVETMKNDINHLCMILGRQPQDSPTRKNTFDLDRNLSPLAIGNLKRFYRNDYRALSTLNRFGLIDEQTLTTYQAYRPIKHLRA